METFVVRVFVPEGDETLELTGIVEHPGTGRSERFQGTEDLVGVVLHQLELSPRGDRLVTPRVAERTTDSISEEAR